MKKSGFYTIAVLLGAAIVLSFSCQNDKWLEKVDDKGVVFQKKAIWKVENISNFERPRGGPSNVKFLNGGLLDTYYTNPQALENEFRLLNVETGEYKWRWRDVIRPTEEISMGDYWGKSVHINNNLLLYQAGPRNYCIDVQTGNTVWKKITGYSGVPLCYGMGDTYFAFGTPLEKFDKGIWEPHIYKGNLKTGREYDFLTPNYSRKYIRESVSKYTVGLIMDLQLIKDNQDTLMVVVFNELGPNKHDIIGFMGLYNLTQKSWIYDRQQMFTELPLGADGSKLVQRGEKIYLVCDNLIACFEWRTGKRLWVKDLPSFAEIQGIFEDRYMVLYDSMSTLYCVDADTGQQIWKLPNETLAYTSSYCAEGILYYLSKGNLRARDLKTTKLLWDIPSDTPNKLDGHFWVFVTGLPGKNGQKGRIFTRTGYHTYCYEAIK